MSGQASLIYCLPFRGVEILYKYSWAQQKGANSEITLWSLIWSLLEYKSINLGNGKLIRYATVWDESMDKFFVVVTFWFTYSLIFLFTCVLFQGEKKDG